MPRIPVRIGQENQIKVITSFGAPNIPYLAVNATNVVGGIVTTTQLSVSGSSEFLGLSTFSDNVYFDQNIEVQGTSSFIGDVTFYGGVIGLGNTNTDNIVFAGEVNSNIIPNLDNTYSLGISTQRWASIYAASLSLIGIGKTYGVAYFGQNSEILSTQSPTTGFQTSNLLLTTNANNIPVWTDTIDGGSY